MIKMGVLGVGYLGEKHAQAIHEIGGATLEGVYDVRAEVAEGVGKRFSCRVFENSDALLESVDAVSVVVPTDRHVDVASRALEAGVHVLVEKPIARSVSEAEALIRLAKEHGLVLQVGHVERFNPAFYLPLEFVERPLFVESHRLSPFVLRGTEVDVILDLMIHDIDLVLELMGMEVSDIWSVGVPVVTSSIDIANTRITFSDNRAASLTASRISQKRMRKVRVFQRDTYLSMDLLERRSVIYRIRWEEGKPSFKEQVFEVKSAVNPLAQELSSFAESIRNGVPPRVSGEEATRALDCALKIRERMFLPPLEEEREGDSSLC